MGKQVTLRRRTVQAGLRIAKHSRKHTFIPIINIQGCWLQQAGFMPHMQVYIHVQEGRIVINSDEMLA
jgi:hypothetical protein